MTPDAQRRRPPRPGTEHRAPERRCERALAPGRLQLIGGGHFDAYVSGFAEASGAARSWFREHLG